MNDYLDTLKHEIPVAIIAESIAAVFVYIISILLQLSPQPLWIAGSLLLMIAVLAGCRWYRQNQVYNKLKEFLQSSSPSEDPTEEDFEKLSELQIPRRQLALLLGKAVCKEQDHSIRASAALWIGAGKMTELTDALAKVMLNDQQRQVRAASAHALGVLGSCQVLESLTKVVDDWKQHQSVRQEAARALGKIGDVTALEVLQKNLLSCHQKMDALKSHTDSFGSSEDNRDNPLLREYNQLADFLIEAIQDIDTHREKDLWVNVYPVVPRFQERIKPRLGLIASERGASA